MQRGILVLIGLFCLRAWGGGCVLPTEPQILLAEGAPDKLGSKLLQYWEVDDSPDFWAMGVPESASLKAFRQTIATAVPDLSPVSLLNRALANLPPATPDSKNLEQALAVAKDRIRPIQCLEGLLLGYQTDRLDMVKFPTEFTAFFLRSRTRPALKIYYYTVNQAGIGKLQPVVSYVEATLKESSDWYLWMNLHNHNFFLNKPNLSGVTSPSGADVGAFRDLATDLDLREAWITNGFDTITLDRSEFWKFHPL